jgi:predicted nucleic acid-binding Zn ribbon protein
MAKKFDSAGGDAVHIGQAINKLLSSYHIKSKFDEANIVSSWERLVGKPIAKRTKKVFIKNKVLFVQIESSSMKHDISLHKSHILEIFQKEFGNDVVQEIVLM